MRLTASNFTLDKFENGSDVVDSDDSGGETNANKTLAGLGRTTLNLSFGNRSSPETQLGNTLSELELLDTFRDTLRTIFGFIINVEDLSDDENSSGRLSKCCFSSDWLSRVRLSFDWSKFVTNQQLENLYESSK